jgi:hypothetical protein
MDEFTREGLAIRVGRLFKSTQVKEVLREVGLAGTFVRNITLLESSQQTFLLSVYVHR